MTLPSPAELDEIIPLSTDVCAKIASFRSLAENILSGKDPRIVLILGPCSIHNCDEALEYASKIEALQKRVANKFFLIMRLFCEKPRSRLGWKGLLYDPLLDGSNNLSEGLKQTKTLLRDIAILGVPAATEFLEPLLAPYLAPLITWGLIGARTSGSQPHRQLASGLPFPVGFKNNVHGELEPAVFGIESALSPHTHFAIDPSGRLSSLQTPGNPLAHLVLRGSELAPNCDPQSVQSALTLLREHGLSERLVIDCAHGNSGKEPHRQREVFQNCLEQIGDGCQAIYGLMLESQLQPGNQPLGEELLAGVSVTDACLGWEETEELVLSAASSFTA